MADDFAQDVLSKLAETLIDKLGSAATQEATQWGGAGDDIESLKDTVTFVRATIMDLEKQQEPRTHQVQNWLDKLRVVLSQADSLMEEVQRDARRRQEMGGGFVGRVKVFFSGNNQIVYGVRMRSRVREIRERIDQIARDRINFQI